MTTQATRRHFGMGHSVSREPVAFKHLGFLSKYLGQGVINVFAYTRDERAREKRAETASLMVGHVIRTTPRIVRALAPFN